MTAAERFGEWSLEFQEEGVVALKLKPSLSLDDRYGAPEVAFVCNQESKYVVVLVAPSPGTFKNQQETVSVAVQRTKNDFDSSDLLQQWDNEGVYIFAEQPDEVDKFTSYLKAQEADGIKSVYFYFPNDLVTGAGKTIKSPSTFRASRRGCSTSKRNAQRRSSPRPVFAVPSFPTY